MKYIEKKPAQYQSNFWGRGATFSPNECRGHLKINIWLCDTLVLLNHLDNITRNQDVLGCSEISINVIFKHVELARIIWTEKVPGAEKFK